MTGLEGKMIGATCTGVQAAKSRLPACLAVCYWKMKQNVFKNTM